MDQPDLERISMESYNNQPTMLLIWDSSQLLDPVWFQFANQYWPSTYTDDPARECQSSNNGENYRQEDLELVGPSLLYYSKKGIIGMRRVG